MSSEAGATCGRVLAVDNGTIILSNASGTHVVDLRGETACKPGDWVAVDSVRGTCEIAFSHPTGEFPKTGGDASRWLGGDRMHALRFRADIMARTRTFFAKKGFLEVETPVLVASPGTEVHLAPFHVSVPSSPQAAKYLRTSPELHMKRMLTAGSGPIFQIGKVFRAGEHGTHHRNEFTMAEWYRPFAGYEAIMTDLEDWFAALGVEEELTYQDCTLDTRRPWPRLTFKDALAKYAPELEPDYDDPESLMRLFGEEVEPKLGRDTPVFLTEYPISLGSLARAKPGAPDVAERFELFMAGLEIGNAFGELTDATEQRRRCEAENNLRAESGLPKYPIDEDFLQALEEGMPPSAGIAVGMDRVVMLLSNAPTIDHVLGF